MAHEWDRGTLTTSSWHGLEDVGKMSTAKDMVDKGEESGAWPVGVELEGLVTSSDLLVDSHAAVVGYYREHGSRVLGVVGGRYRATSPQEWRDLVAAVVEAGARPTGAFSLRDGSRVLATFDVGDDNGIKTQMVLADSFDGSLGLTCGFTSIRVVCSNTLAASMRHDGKEWAKIRHTKSLEDKVRVLRDSIGQALKSGQEIREAYEQASSTKLTARQAQEVFDRLFPQPDDDATDHAKTRAENNRSEALKALKLEVNQEGDSLASIWNAATYLVDRKSDGSQRPARGGSDMLDSLLFGQRAKRIEEIREIMVDVIMTNGDVQPMTVREASSAGVDPQQTGRAILESILGE